MVQASKANAALGTYNHSLSGSLRPSLGVWALLAAACGEGVQAFKGRERSDWDLTRVLQDVWPQAHCMTRPPPCPPPACDALKLCCCVCTVGGRGSYNPCMCVCRCICKVEAAPKSWDAAHVACGPTLCLLLPHCTVAQVVLLLQVQYSASGFLEKNRDTLPANIRGLFINSITPLLSVLFTGAFPCGGKHPGCRVTRDP